MINIELLSFSFKSFTLESNEGISSEALISFYSENSARDKFEDFASKQLKLYSERLLGEGKYFELVSVTTQVVTTTADIIYVFSLELEDEDLYED